MLPLPGKYLKNLSERIDLMKRLLTILLSVCLIFVLCGCEELEKLENIELPPLPTQTTAPTPEVSPEPSPEPEASIEPVYNEPDCQIIVNTINTAIEEFDPAEGKELILSYSYDTPVVYIEGRDNAAAKINESIALLDETHYTGNDHGMGDGTGGFNMMLEQAQDNFGYVYNTGTTGVSLEFTASRTAGIERADGSVLTIVYDDYYFTGGENGTHYTRGYSFDTESGEKLSIDSLSQDAEAFRSFLVDAMLSMAESDEEIAGKIDVSSAVNFSAADAFAGLLRDGSWYLDNNGLCIFSDASELGAYESGEVYFRIPYEQLEGWLIDRLIPAKRSGEAELSIGYLSDVQNGSVEIVDRVVADEDGEELCLSIIGTAYDVKLSTVDYTDGFFETAQLWYASYMSHSAIQVLTNIPEGMPNLMISYSDTQGENHRMLISQSGEDGSLQLVDDSIEAVG